MKKNSLKDEDKGGTYFSYDHLFQDLLDKNISEFPKTIKINCLEENYEEFYYIHMVKNKFFLNFPNFLTKDFQKFSRNF